MDSTDRPAPNSPSNRSSQIVFILGLGWIGLTSVLIYGITWQAQQTLIIEDIPWPVWAWPVATLVYGLLLIVPFGPLARFWRVPRYRVAFQTWAVTSVFVFFLVPARFAPFDQAQLAAVLQIAGTLLYLAFVIAVIRRRQRRGGPGFARPTPPYLPVLVLAPLLAYSWVAWGALGSILDSLLNLVAALLFGLAAGFTVGHFLIGPLRRASSQPDRDFTLGGFAAGASLMIMGAAFGFNGLELLLLVMLPVLGRMLLVFSRLGRRTPEASWLALAMLVGLVAAAPMLLVDPDELVLVLNLGSRDVLQWSLYAMLVTAVGGWVLGMLLFLFRSRLSGRLVPSRRGTRPLMTALAGTTWLASIAIYFLVGQPGLYGERLFVILKDQADVSSAATIADYGQRREFVYRTLVKHANTTQAGIRGALDRIGVDYTPYYLVNALEVRAGPLVRMWLNTRPEVDRILDCPVLRPLPAPSPPARGDLPAPSSPQWDLTSIGANRVWTELGITGQGIVVGQSDSGVQWDHPELKPTYRGYTERGGASSNPSDYNWYDPWNHTTVPTDAMGHGTHTLGSAVGQTVGVAPGATWYACVNLARNLGNPALYLDCMQFMLVPFPIGGDPFVDGDPALGAHVINDSWGCPEIEGCDPDAMLNAVQAMRAAGVFVVASAGNEGTRCGSVDAPLALYDASFSVGAVDSSGGLAFFSSRGPVTVDGSDRTKPDIVAPGVDVLSAYPGSTYTRESGTSQAGPHVVGVVALMWSANSSLIGDIEQTEAILAASARPYDYARHGLPNCAQTESYPNNAVGYGLVDAYAAVTRALQQAPAQ
jgi:hypothetical protein